MVLVFSEFEEEIDIEIEVFEGEWGVVVGFDFIFEVLINILFNVRINFFIFK